MYRRRSLLFFIRKEDGEKENIVVEAIIQNDGVID